MKLKDIIDIGEIEIKDESIEVVRKLGHDPKRIIELIFQNAFGTIIHRYMKNRCDECGKLIPIMIPSYMRKRYKDDLCECC